MGAWVYIDGFNLYYGALKGRPYRWLNLKALADELLPAGRQVERVKYFTARVSGAIDPDAPRRQQVYLNALRTVPEVEVFFGKFLAKTIWRPLINLPIANRQVRAPNPFLLAQGTYSVIGPPDQRIVVGSYPAPGGRSRKLAKPLSDAIVVEAHTMEEKGSDVNLATHLLNDAWAGEFSEALVVTNDTDLVSPIEIVAEQRGLPVTVASPDSSFPVAPALAQVATHSRHISRQMLVKSQFPNPVVVNGGKQIAKPDPNW